MIQILGLRLKADAKHEKDKTLTFFERKWRAPTIPLLLEDIDEFLRKIPTQERYNLFFTHYQCGTKRKEFDSLSDIPFDFDLINDDEPLPEGTRASSKDGNPYLKLFEHVTGLGPSDYAAIFTGHGLHLIVHLSEPYKDASCFTELRPHYRTLCKKIEDAIHAAGLPLKEVDQGLFKTGSVGFRLPGTENRKKDKKPTPVKLLQNTLPPLSFDLIKLSGLPHVKASDQMEESTLKRYPPSDQCAVLQGCDFLKHCHENQPKIAQPLWFAMLGIVGRLKDGEKLAHDYSHLHPGYSVDETNAYLDLALKNYGPRTCEGINALWDQCKNCPNFKSVKTPLLIRSENFIETEHTGFHSTFYDEKKGITKVGKPQHEDLRRFFDRLHHYKVMGASGICYVWSGTHYRLFEDPYLKEFAQHHFNPTASRDMRAEFKDLVCSTKLTPPEWFLTTTEKKINFKNGILDLETGELAPHSMEHGFRYCLPYDYAPHATAPTFEKFLRDVTKGDRELQHVLLEFVGYAFSGDFPKHGKTLVLTGTGSNGKSTFIEVLKALAGEANYSALDWKGLRSETARQLMDGKLFNLAEESPKDALKDSAFFKNIITGGEMLVNMKYKQPYTIRNKTKLIWACNELPGSDDTTKGFFRRFLIIPWNAEFSDEKGNDDKDLREKLLKELSGIFNLVKQGYERLSVNKKFTSSEASDLVLQQYKDEVDHASRWIKENVFPQELNGGERFVVIAKLYAAYRREIEESGYHPIPSGSFGKKLSQIIPECEARRKQKKVEGKNERILLDCTWTSSEKH